MQPVDPEILLSLTDFGDGALLAGMVCVIASYLARGRRWEKLIRLLACILLAALGVAIAKLYFLSCPARGVFAAPFAPSFGPLLSPSGHAAMGLAAYGSIAALAGAHVSPRKGARVCLWFAFLAWAGAIGLSRVLLGFHGWGEVALGWAIGGLALAAAWGLHPTHRPAPPRGSRRELAGLLVLLMVTAGWLHGMRLPAEPWLRELAARISKGGPRCAA